MSANRSLSATGASDLGLRTRAQVDELAASFRAQLQKTLGVPEEQLQEKSALAYADHYLSSLADEDREPILTLVSAQAGAWFGELVRREIGATWVGDGVDPRRLRLLMEPQFLYFSPVDQALEAALLGSPEPGDPRVADMVVVDSAFQLRKTPPSAEPDGPSDDAWIREQLEHRPPLPNDEFFSLTGRFEALELILELLATRSAGRGESPTRYHLSDYLAVLTPESSD